jgi:hypothetical protein
LKISDDDHYVEYVPLKRRRVAALSSLSGAPSDPEPAPRSASPELLAVAPPDTRSTEETIAAREAELLARVSERKALVTAKEHAKGIKYTESLKTDWVPPKYLRDRGKQFFFLLKYIYI